MQMHVKQTRCPHVDHGKTVDVELQHPECVDVDLAIAKTMREDVQAKLKMSKVGSAAISQLEKKLKAQLALVDEQRAVAGAALAKQEHDFKSEHE